MVGIKTWSNLLFLLLMKSAHFREIRGTINVCVTMGKLLNCFVPPFPQLQDENNLVPTSQGGCGN